MLQLIASILQVGQASMAGTRLEAECEHMLMATAPCTSIARVYAPSLVPSLDQLGFGPVLPPRTDAWVGCDVP